MDSADRTPTGRDARRRRSRGLRMGVVAAGVAGSLGVVPAASGEPGTGSSVTGSSTSSAAPAGLDSTARTVEVPSRRQGQTAPGLRRGSGAAHATTGGS